MRWRRTAGCLSGVALVILGIWIIFATRWGLVLVGELGWMWWVSLAAGVVIILLGLAIAVVEALRLGEG